MSFDRATGLSRQDIQNRFQENVAGTLFGSVVSIIKMRKAQPRLSKSIATSNRESVVRYRRFVAITEDRDRYRNLFNISWPLNRELFAFYSLYRRDRLCSRLSVKRRRLFFPSDFNKSAMNKLNKRTGGNIYENGCEMLMSCCR